MLITLRRLPILWLGITVLLIPLPARAQLRKREVYDNALVSFALPPTGALVRLDLSSGMCITGTFVRVLSGAVTLQHDGEDITFPRHALREECRTNFFARDYANSLVSEIEDEEQSRRSLQTEKRRLNEESRQHLVQLTRQLEEHQDRAAVYIYVGDRGRRIDYIDGTGSSLWRGARFNPGDELYAASMPDDKLQYYTESNIPRVIPAADFVPMKMAADALRTRLENAENDYHSSQVRLARTRDRLAFLSDSVAPENVAKRQSAKLKVQELEKQTSEQKIVAENYRNGLERFLRSMKTGKH